jgi:hypothetical protein
MPEKEGIQAFMFFWIPACAGMTRNAPSRGLVILACLRKKDQRILFFSTLVHFRHFSALHAMEEFSWEISNHEHTRR